MKEHKISQRRRCNTVLLSNMSHVLRKSVIELRILFLFIFLMWNKVKFCTSLKSSLIWAIQNITAFRIKQKLLILHYRRGIQCLKSWWFHKDTHLTWMIRNCTIEEVSGFEGLQNSRLYCFKTFCCYCFLRKELSILETWILMSKSIIGVLYKWNLSFLTVWNPAKSTLVYSCLLVR